MLLVTCDRGCSRRAASTWVWERDSASGLAQALQRASLALDGSSPDLEKLLQALDINARIVDATAKIQKATEEQQSEVVKGVDGADGSVDLSVGASGSANANIVVETTISPEREKERRLRMLNQSLRILQLTYPQDLL